MHTLFYRFITQSALYNLFHNYHTHLDSKKTGILDIYLRKNEGTNMFIISRPICLCKPSRKSVLSWLQWYTYISKMSGARTLRKFTTTILHKVTTLCDYFTIDSLPRKWEVNALINLKERHFASKSLYSINW